MSKRIAIIGGGAAGFFAAINTKENFPNADVVIFEKSKKLLAKVKVSGGGRCNVTNGCKSLKELVEGYPRGSKVLKKSFKIFDNKSTQKWFDKRGVPLYVQDDNRAFPTSNNSQTIIDCFLKETDRLKIRIELNRSLERLEWIEGNWSLGFRNAEENLFFDNVIMATGGASQRKGLGLFEQLGHQIIEPVPSLFTFNMPSEPISKLMGLVVENTSVAIQGTKIKTSGALLITHWGMSGPAILRLSAFGARKLNELGYDFNIQVSWVNNQNFDRVFHHLKTVSEEHANKLLVNFKPYGLPERLWLFLLKKCEFQSQKKWNELGKKGINKLVNLLSNDVYKVKGKTVFKEEFVTCGGISLESINQTTMESKACKNLYFAGEILDIDGITGGYNFQAAWTTGFIASKLQ